MISLQKKLLPICHGYFAQQITYTIHNKHNTYIVFPNAYLEISICTQKLLYLKCFSNINNTILLNAPSYLIDDAIENQTKELIQKNNIFMYQYKQNIKNAKNNKLLIIGILPYTEINIQHKILIHK